MERRHAFDPRGPVCAIEYPLPCMAMPKDVRQRSRVGLPIASADLLEPTRPAAKRLNSNTASGGRQPPGDVAGPQGNARAVAVARFIARGAAKTPAPHQPADAGRSPGRMESER